MQGILGRQIEAERQALERDAMNMRGGVLRQEPSMLQTIGSQAKRLFFGDKNMYGNDPLQPSVMDSQYVRPEMAEGAVLDVVGGPMATAFHGSPHKFSKFDMSKIGTGEGATAYGHGLYFAENPNVAKDYQRNIRKDGGWGLQEHGAFDKLKNFKGEPIPENMVAEINSAWAARGPEAGKEKAIELFDKNRGEPFSDALNEIAFYGNWEPKGNLYKVDIPDEHIDKMLDWDKPLSEQPKSVMDAVDKILPKSKRDSLAMRGLFGRDDYTKFHTGKTIAKPLGELTGKEIQVGLSSEIRSAFGSDAQNYREALGDADKFLKAVAGREKNSDSLTSAVLKREGIKGIKYLDQGSRGAGKGTSNFVVFDDQIPQILEINDKPLKGVLSGQ